MHYMYVGRLWIMIAVMLPRSLCKELVSAWKRQEPAYKKLAEASLAAYTCAATVVDLQECMCVCVCVVVGNRCTTWVYLCTVMPKVSYIICAQSGLPAAPPTRRAEALFSVVIPFFSFTARNIFDGTKHAPFFFSSSASPFLGTIIDN